MTHTEKVHVIFGMLAAITGALALWHAHRSRSRVGQLWPVFALIIGLCLFVPVEAQTRTYLEVSWWGTVFSVVPDSPQYWLDNWFAKLSSWHVVQHKAGGLMIIIVGVVEWLGIRGRLAKSGWRYVLPILLVAIGVAFGVHGGGPEHLPFRTEQLQHQVFGVGFALAGVVQGMVVAGRLGGGWRAAWATLVLLVGFNITFLYRIEPEGLQTGGHHHASVDSRLR